MNIRILALALVITIGFSSCEDEEVVKPYPTTDVLTAEINGKPWQAKTQTFSGPPVITGLDANNLFTVTSHNTWDGFDTEVRLRVFDVTDTGTYILNNHNPGRGSYKANSSQDPWFYTDSTTTGTLIITNINRADKKIEATFSFDAKNSRGEFVAVRNGYLNVNYQ